jgi:hypothetical protein
MSNRTINSKTQSAAQRWKATGLSAPAPLKDRLMMLDAIMLRQDLSATEQRICYYLMRFITDNETGLCFISDEALAEKLGVTRRAIQKCKKSLKAKKVLSWSTERTNGKNQVCLYRVIYREGGNARSPLHGEPAFTINPSSANESSPLTANKSSPSNQTEKHYAKFGSAELAAWDLWSQNKTGRSLPRNRDGGWYVASQWPPAKELTIAEIFDL